MNVNNNLIDSMRSFQFDPDKVKIGRPSNDGVFSEIDTNRKSVEKEPVAAVDDSTAASARQSAEAQQASAKTLVLTQVIANQNTPQEESESSSAIDEFLDFASKSYEEKVRALVLKGFGITEEELASLPTDERAKMEEKIKEKIKEYIENDIA